ncbi:MAG: selenoprotein B glycine/betaine/sarcosine/D-proline reductase [Desulfobacterium sp.]|nr:selenoprotein B glycine/betaine/sarcosine/D-proline reductase [Desulfobacterium sp.]
MTRLDRLPSNERAHLLALPCPDYDETALVKGPGLNERKVALISTAGLQRRNDRPFGVGADDYRIIGSDTPPSEIVMSHISTNYDRTGYQQDINVVFPLQRLKELAKAGEIGSVAQYHYSFMGATDPTAMEKRARELARIMKAEGVNAVLLVPV